MYLNPNGVADNAWENTKVTITIIGNTATIPIQEASKKVWGEALECLLLDEGCS